MKRGKKTRTAQQRGPLPPRKARSGNGPRSLDGLLYGGFELDKSERHLENFHRLSPESPDDDTYFRFTRALIVAARRWRKVANDRIKTLDQTMVRWETLYLVAYSGEELTQSELARVVGVEGPTMVRMLHLLAEEGLLERHQSRDDLRMTINRITEKGRKVIADIMSITNQLRREMLDGIEADELMVAQKVLTRMMRNLEEAQTGRRSAAVRAGDEDMGNG